MPFYFRSFWEAVEELPDWMIVAYLRSLSYNWGHRSCKGLRNDEQGLRKTCRIESDDNWSKAWNTIFTGTEYWVLGEDDLWHQKFQDELWIEANDNYSARVNGGKKRASMMHPAERKEIASNAAKKRWENTRKNEKMLVEQALQQAPSKHKCKH